MSSWRHDMPPLREAALFLDFDGTLVDLAPTPDAIFIPPDLSSFLGALSEATHGALAIVSGRRLSDLEAFLPEFDGPMVGGHGAEWRVSGIHQRHEIAGTPELRDAQEAMIRFADLHPGRLYEAKPTGGVLHFRQDPTQETAVADFVASVAARSPGLERHSAKMAEEIRPIGIGKEHAVARLMAQPPFMARSGVFFGDDATDEPAMSWLLSNGGTAVKIGTGETCAPHRMNTPSEVRAALAAWLSG